MPLHEVSSHLLKKTESDVLYRFFQDTADKITLFLWQNLDSAGHKSDIAKFQISFQEHILEWRKNGHLKYGKVDEGEIPMAIKQSPVMIMENRTDPEVIALILKFLQGENRAMLPEIDFIIEVLKQH